MPPAPPTPSASATVASKPPSPTPATPAPVHEDDVSLQLDAYREQFDATFELLLGDQPKALLERPAAKPLGHQVVSYARARGSLMVTVGFARREQRYAHGETPKRVELMAESPTESPHVALALAALGAWMHADDRPIDVRFKAFEPLRLDQPLFDMTHFLLMPAGTAKLPDGEQVTLLRVIPAAEEEYAHVKMRGDGAARAWWHHHRGDPTLPKRWGPVLAHDR